MWNSPQDIVVDLEKQAVRQAFRKLPLKEQLVLYDVYWRGYEPWNCTALPFQHATSCAIHVRSLDNMRNMLGLGKLIKNRRYRHGKAQNN